MIFRVYAGVEASVGKGEPQGAAYRVGEVRGSSVVREIVSQSVLSGHQSAEAKVDQPDFVTKILWPL